MIEATACSLSNPRFRSWLNDNHYFNLREIEGVGVCGMCRMAFTVGVMVNLNWFAYDKRFCFSSLGDALAFLQDWDGKTTPVPGEHGCTAIK